MGGVAGGRQTPLGRHFATIVTQHTQLLSLFKEKRYILKKRAIRGLVEGLSRIWGVDTATWVKRWVCWVSRATKALVGHSGH